ncbi:HD-GYP domain-containing protein [Bradyrhizobium liaoningense]|uniref:HD-GYP domain-containing protein n=1 Tax=Bradyrhizobium liaoningense TaxID=43992 RepID=UPI001BA8A4AE|nr:HD domain-containing phosphohydrolase [Bradyrhizobium liaoningense]MBR0705891.1 HD domain-containing protein [Bradyrhizobium liaoningense]
MIRDSVPRIEVQWRNSRSDRESARTIPRPAVKSDGGVRAAETARPLVQVLADTSGKLSGIRSILEEKFTVAGERLDADAKLAQVPYAIVVRAELRDVDNITAIKKRAGKLAKARKRVFLLEHSSHVGISQAYALGATLVLPGTINRIKLLAALSDHAAPVTASPGGEAQQVDAVETAATAIASMFTSVTLGQPLDVDGTREAGRQIADRIIEHGLSEWLTTVRRHHEGTYQHCLLVTGVTIDFGLSLGVGKADLERLYSAAMFHDIGKAQIPLAILDKPGRLDAEERALIETHPAAGYGFLKDHEGISPEILDAVLHHHEYLDGSGYPDGLCAESIGDIVRILTISDIFAALIEHRHYKPTMPRAEAYNILCGMNGKLENALVASFKQVALTR